MGGQCCLISFFSSARDTHINIADSKKLTIKLTYFLFYFHAFNKSDLVRISADFKVPTK